MNIDELTTENNVYRDVIDRLKNFIHDCDRNIQLNELEIGRQLEVMNKKESCDLCLGECNGNV